jgi:hypothetical protein
LNRSGYRDQFKLVTWWAAEPLDLLRALQERPLWLSSCAKILSVFHRRSLKRAQHGEGNSERSTAR